MVSDINPAHYCRVIPRGDNGAGPEADISLEMDGAQRGYLRLADAQQLAHCWNTYPRLLRQRDAIRAAGANLLANYNYEQAGGEPATPDETARLYSDLVKAIHFSGGDA